VFVPFTKFSANGLHTGLAELLDEKDGVMLWNLRSPRMNPVILE
jgi:hypothetical protein